MNLQYCIYQVYHYISKASSVRYKIRSRWFFT